MSEIKQGIAWNPSWGDCCPSVALELVRMDLENVNYFRSEQKLYHSSEQRFDIDPSQKRRVQRVTYEFCPNIIEEYHAREREILAWLSDIQKVIIKTWHHPLSPCYRDFQKTARRVEVEIPSVSVRWFEVRHNVFLIENRIAWLMYPTAMQKRPKKFFSKKPDVVQGLEVKAG